MSDNPIGPGPIEEFRRQIELRNPVRSHHVTIDEVHAALTGIPRVKGLSMADVHGIVRKLNANQDAKSAATQPPPADATGEVTDRMVSAGYAEARNWAGARTHFEVRAIIAAALAERGT